MATFYYNHESELYHYGVLGMKWGIRRYQNKDGSLTEAGKKRYLTNNGQLTNKGKKAFYDKKGNKTEVGEKYFKTQAEESIKKIASELPKEYSGMTYSTAYGDFVNFVKRPSDPYKTPYEVQIPIGLCDLSKAPKDNARYIQDKVSSAEKNLNRVQALAKKYARDELRDWAGDRTTKEFNKDLNKIFLAFLAFDRNGNPEYWFDDNGALGYHSLVYQFDRKGQPYFSLEG